MIIDFIASPRTSDYEFRYDDILTLGECTSLGEPTLGLIECELELLGTTLDDYASTMNPRPLSIDDCLAALAKLPDA